MSSAVEGGQKIGVGGLKLGALEKEYINQVLESNRLSYGPFTERFEEQFAKAHGCDFAIFCNSGTSALHLAVAALKQRHGWQDGDEILVPAVTFVATSNVVLHNGLQPVFVDVDPRLYNLDPQQLSRHLTPRTRAIMPVHLFGMPCTMEPIVEFAKTYDLRIVEDSCETMFADYRAQSVGSFGDIGCFSTYIAHLLVTGVGGLATTNDAHLAGMLRSLMNHGRDGAYLKISDDDDLTKERLFSVVSKRFSFTHLGHSFRATELEAALGLAQLEQIEEIIRKRKENASYLSGRLRSLEDHLQLPHIPTDRDHVFMMYPIVVRAGEKTELVRWLEERGIETRDMLPLLNQPIYTEMFGDLERDYPVAQWINQSGFYVGVHQHLDRTDMDYLADTIAGFFA